MSEPVLPPVVPVLEPPVVPVLVPPVVVVLVPPVVAEVPPVLVLGVPPVVAPGPTGSFEPEQPAIASQLAPIRVRAEMGMNRAMAKRLL
jgi:hypothetical protein